MSKHCLMCGMRHDGDCPDDAFNYFKCSSCSAFQMMPQDCPVYGITCGCGTPAEEGWKGITATEYKAGESDE